MPIFQVKRRTVEEETFYVEVDASNDLDKVIHQGIQDTSKLQELLMNANCKQAVTREGKSTSWSLDYASEDKRPQVVGKLDILTKYYAKVKFNVTHAFTFLFEVNTKKRSDVLEILNENIDYEFGDIVKEISPSMYRDEFLTDTDYEVVEWSPNKDHIEGCPPIPVRVYTQED